jgi:hypothetical protein
MIMFRTTHFVTVALSLALAACTPPQSQPQSPAEAPATTAAAPSTGPVVIATPVSGARVTSPLIVEGSAPGDWYFEAQFYSKLVGADGAVLAEAPAMAQTEWMTEAPVAYRAQLTFSVTQETLATLVLQEDMPADNANPREVSVPVLLVPAS